MSQLECDCYADAAKDLTLCNLHRAAPELLEALLDLVQEAEELEYNGLDKARAAIALAKGDSK